MFCSRCEAEVIGGWHDGEGHLVCLACIRRAARRSRILGYLDQLHAALKHAGAIEDCRTCEIASIMEPVR